MKRFLLLLPFIFAGFGASAQSDPQADRIERLERDIMLMQRQMARGGNAPASRAAYNTGAEISPSADMEVRLSAIEEAMRDLQGRIEENGHEVRKVSETLEKFQRDTEFRFSEINPGATASSAGGSASASAPAPAPAPAPATVSDTPAPETTTLKPRVSLSETPDETSAETTTAGDGVLRVPEENPTEADNYSTPRDLYNYAFRLLNQTRYEDAANAFSAFTKKYPKDPLIGNAYYWQGETFYIRRDYVNAADSFRQGFEALPSGPKAPDNLLKLAMSLDALGRDKESCVVLGQIITKFKKTSVSIVDKANQEYKRINCK